MKRIATVLSLATLALSASASAADDTTLTDTIYYKTCSNDGFSDAGCLCLAKSLSHATSVDKDVLNALMEDFILGSKGQITTGTAEAALQERHLSSKAGNLGDALTALSKAAHSCAKAQ